MKAAHVSSVAVQQACWVTSMLCRDRAAEQNITHRPVTWPAPLQATPVQLQVSSVASAQPLKLPVTAAQLLMPCLKLSSTVPAAGSGCQMLCYPRPTMAPNMQHGHVRSGERRWMPHCAHLRSYAAQPLAPPSAPPAPGTRRDTAGKLTACRLAGSSSELLAGVQLHAKSATSCAAPDVWLELGEGVPAATATPKAHDREHSASAQLLQARPPRASGPRLPPATLLQCTFLPVRAAGTAALLCGLMAASMAWPGRICHLITVPATCAAPGSSWAQTSAGLWGDLVDQVERSYCPGSGLSP